MNEQSLRAGPAHAYQGWRKTEDDPWSLCTVCACPRSHVNHDVPMDELAATKPDPATLRREALRFLQGWFMARGDILPSFVESALSK